MKFILLFLTLSSSLAICSLSNATTIKSESSKYSINKKKYMESCVEALSKDSCSCQFDVINPILSKHLGSNWVNGKMEEKDYDVYLYATQKAVNKCLNR